MEETKIWKNRLCRLVVSTNWVAGKDIHCNHNVEKTKSNWGKKYFRERRMKSYALIVNHKVSVCSSSRNWDRKPQDLGVFTWVHSKETQHMFPQMFMHETVFSCCFHTMKEHTEHVLVINFSIWKCIFKKSFLTLQRKWQ